MAIPLNDPNYEYQDLEDLLLSHSEDEDGERYVYNGEEYDSQDEALEELLTLNVVNKQSALVRAIERAEVEEVELESDAFGGLVKLYMGYSGADQMRWDGGTYSDKAEWAEKATEDSFGKIPDHVVVDWDATADGLLMDYVAITLDNRRFMAFRK